ncbi:uncharacterized protein LOC144205207 isoform X2 [Stigmatopora nigra]
MTECCQLDSDVMDDVSDLSAEDSTGQSPNFLGQNGEEHVKVYLRIRPATAGEWPPAAGCAPRRERLWVEPPDTVAIRSAWANPASEKGTAHAVRRFHFSRVYGPDTGQRELFRGTVKELVGHLLAGGNSLVFTYGVTNAGKTFTFLGTAEDAGVLPRSLDLIFSSLGEKVSERPAFAPHRCREVVVLSQERRARDAAFKENLLRRLKDGSHGDGTPDSGWLPREKDEKEEPLSLGVEARAHFSVWLSFCEIYNESIHDLLEAAPAGAGRRTALRLSQDARGDAFVKDLRWVQVDDVEQALAVVKLGKRNQSFSSTGVNRLSSRSHSIFSIRIVRTEDGRDGPEATVSELRLCDLAGSERCDKTGNGGQRLKEAGNINASLLILGKCMGALRHNRHAKAPPKHVPFRESKLTRYLQSYLSGGGGDGDHQVRMLVNVSRCASAIDETLRVLKFAALAQKVLLVPGEDREGEAGKTAAQWESQAEDRREESTWTEDASQSQDDFQEQFQHAVECGEMTRQQAGLVTRLRLELEKERADKASAEARLREDLGAEFSALVAKMQDDFTERLARERELVEERAERRLEIFKMLTGKMAACAQDHRPDSSRDTGRRDSSQDSGQEAGRREATASALRAVQRKDGEPEERALRIARLEELGKEDRDKVRSLTRDLERKEELVGELREKMADYKKQMQRVQAQISGTREESQLLRRKMSHGEKLMTELRAELVAKERIIRQLGTDQAAAAERDGELEAQRRLADDMRATLLEQEETQEQMESALEEKLRLIQELRLELERAKETPTRPQGGDHVTPTPADHAPLAPESRKPSEEKHQAERLKWRQDKMSLIAQLKEAEQRRNQEVKKFARDREGYLARQAGLEAELVDKDQKMESWRKERDGLLADLEVQIKKLLASLAQKEQLIQQLAGERASSPPEGSSGGPSLLESSQISTENGRASRFPQPQLEISFSPLRPDRLALRPRGHAEAVTVKMAPCGRKRKSAGDKRPIFPRCKRPAHPRQDEVEKENERNRRAETTPTRRQEREPRPTATTTATARSPGKGGTLRKIGDFLQSSPTLIGSTAKKMMSLVSSGVDASASSESRQKRKRKLAPADISSPMDVPPHPMLENAKLDRKRRNPRHFFQEVQY